MKRYRKPLATGGLVLVLILLGSLSIACKGGGSKSSPPAPPPVAEKPPPAPAPAPTPAEAAPAPAPSPAPVVFNDQIPPEEYLDNLFKGKRDAGNQLYIPGYSYVQGAVGSGGDITVAGQVRVIGGATTGPGGVGRLEDGAMMTTDPEYLQGRVPPSREKFRIVEWKEVD